MTPLFVGGEPVVTTTGKYAGNAILQSEQDAGLAFMRALDSSQQATARLAKEKTRDDLQAGMNQPGAALPGPSGRWALAHPQGPPQRDLVRVDRRHNGCT